MKHLSLFLASLLALFVSGCGSSHAQPTEAPPAPASSFKAGAGLQLSAGARELIGLATVDVSTPAAGTSTPQWIVPTSALIRTVKGDYVFVANGERFLRTPVVVSEVTGETMRVSDGLYEGDTIVARGALPLWLAELQAVNGGVGCADGK